MWCTIFLLRCVHASRQLLKQLGAVIVVLGLLALRAVFIGLLLVVANRFNYRVSKDALTVRVLNCLLILLLVADKVVLFQTTLVEILLVTAADGQKCAVLTLQRCMRTFGGPHSSSGSASAASGSSQRQMSCGSARTRKAFPPCGYAGGGSNLKPKVETLILVTTYL